MRLNGIFQTACQLPYTDTLDLRCENGGEMVAEHDIADQCGRWWHLIVWKASRVG